MTRNDLDKLVKYVSITLSHSHSSSLDIYLNDIVDFCRLNLLKEPISEEELDELAMIKYPCNCSLNETYCDCCMNPDLKEAYKAGYRKALEYGKI